MDSKLGREELFRQGILAKGYPEKHLKLINSKGLKGNITLRFSLIHPMFVRSWDEKKDIQLGQVIVPKIWMPMVILFWVGGQ